MFDRCITCGKWMPEFQEPFCSDSCKDSWNADQMQIDAELEEEKARSFEDPNAGCWSYSW